MNCDDAIELLPWLLNGTLESAERDEVRRHLATCERCRAALDETRQAWTTFDQHLPAEALISLAYGEPPAGVDAAVAERHLASCPQCAAELELARMSRRLEEDEKIALFPAALPLNPAAAPKVDSLPWRAAAIAAGLTAIVASGGWFHELRQASSLAQRPTQAAIPPAPAPAPAQTSPAAETGALKQQLDSLAATLQQLQERDKSNQEQARGAMTQLAEMQKERGVPHAGSVFVLDTQAVVRGGEAPEASAPREVHGSSLPSTLLLQAMKDEQGAAGRRAEITDDTGKRLDVQDLLPLNDLGYYALALPAGFLKPGHRYMIQLSDAQNGQKREQFTLHVQ
jgi:hypothetical protein